MVEQPLVTGEMKVEKLMQMFHAEEELKQDIQVKLNEVRVNQDGLFQHGDKIMQLSEGAFKQLCQQTYNYALPVDYMKKLYDNDKDQFISLMNYHLQNGKDVERNFRTILQDDDSFKVRGIVSNSYVPFDNTQALEVFQKSMERLGHTDYILKTTNVRDNGMFLRFVLPKTGKKFGESFEGHEDWNYVSVDLINGETGMSSLKVLASVFRLVCTNGMVALDVVKGLNKRHTGDLGGIVGDMKTTITNGIAIANQSLEDLEKSRNIIVNNPYEEIQKYAKIAKLTEPQAKTVRENFEIEADNSLMGIVNAFTRTGRDITNIDRRIEMERFANRILKTELSKVA